MNLARSVADVLAEHVSFELECIDRMYCNVYQPRLQHVGGVVGYVRHHLGLPVPSTVPLGAISDRFIKQVHAFAATHQVPWVDFVKGQRKDDVMHDQLAVFEASGRTEGVLFVGRAQEKTTVFRTEKRRNATGHSYPWIVQTTGMVNHFYFYCVDADFGPFFLKFCSYFPYTAKLCFNGHHWAQRQAAKAGIGFTAMDNAFAAVDDPAAVQAICDRFGPGHIQALLDKWLGRLPDPFTPDDRADGFDYQISILQAEFSLTQMLDAPVTGRVFFEHVIRDNLDIGRADQIGLIFNRRIHHGRKRSTPSRFRTRVITDGVTPSLHAEYKHTREAVPQGRTSTSNRDHHQQPRRLPPSERSGESVRAAEDRLLRQPAPTRRPTTRPRSDRGHRRSPRGHRPRAHRTRQSCSWAADRKAPQPRPVLGVADLPHPTRRVHQP